MSVTKQNLGHRKDAILDAVLAVAAEEGFGAVSIRKVAALAGVSHSLVTYHYKNKDRLIFEAWWALYERQHLRRDETVGHAGGINRVVEGFRLAFEEETLPGSLRIDFWATAARTSKLKKLFAERRDSLRARNLRSLGRSVQSGQISSELAQDLALVDDFLQVMQYGVHTWAALQFDQEAAGKRAMDLLELFKDLLASGKRANSSAQPQVPKTAN